MSIRKAVIYDLKVINWFLKEMGMLALSEQDFYQSYRMIYLVEINKQIISFICFLVLTDEIELEAIYVKPEFRKNGYGCMLLQKMFDDGKNLGCKQIFLEVRETNQCAKKLYIKNGFIVISCRMKYYGNENGLVMKKEIR